MSFEFDDFLVTFMSIIFEALPFLVVGALISGALEELLPQQFFTRILPKNRFLALVGSSMMGILLPMCECGIVPVMRRLMRKGVPASCAITYMLSAPVINVIVLSSTAMAFWSEYYTLFGVPGLSMVLLRGGLAFVTAVSVGMLVERLARRNIPLVREQVERARLIESDESTRLLEEDHVLAEHEQGHDHDHAHDHDHGHAHDHTHDHKPAGRRSLLNRLTAIADIALGDFLDICAFLIIGAALAAAVNTMITRVMLEDMAEYRSLSILGMMGLAILLSLCSEADAFVAANFGGLGSGARLGFLVLGPMLDIKLYIMYRWVFTKKAVRTIVGSLLVIIFVLCQIVDFGEILLVSPGAGAFSGS